MISLETLTNGEQIILLSILWEFLSKEVADEEENIDDNEIKQVLLLDEPDAHMHPSAILQLINAINRLVNVLKVQVIMTTHNPVTINLMDEKNLFLLFKNDSKLCIRPSLTKYEISSLLTSNLVSVKVPNISVY